MGFFKAHRGVILTGLVVGVLAPVLVKLGNPGNMGVCVACFERDIAGALGLHRAGVVQYLRPEIIGFILGSFLAALAFREFRPRGGSSPILRFVLGFFAMVGALVFLGCPWRVALRLAGGDGNAIVGLLGLVAGIWGGVAFLKRGFTLGRSTAATRASGMVLPILAVALLVLAVAKPVFSPGGPIFASVEGPGSQHAPLLLALAAGLLIGALAQRSRFCTVGAFRDVMLTRDLHLFSGVATLIVAAWVMNLLLGQFHPGFAGQPVAHTSVPWNFLGMVLAGLAYTLAGGCPGRQLFLSGEGDGDAGIFVLGMVGGAAFAHNFALASSAKGPSVWGPGAVVLGLVICAAIGMASRERA